MRCWQHSPGSLASGRSYNSERPCPSSSTTRPALGSYNGVARGPRYRGHAVAQARPVAAMGTLDAATEIRIYPDPGLAAPQASGRPRAPPPPGPGRDGWRLDPYIRGENAIHQPEGGDFRLDGVLTPISGVKTPCLVVGPQVVVAVSECTGGRWSATVDHVAPGRGAEDVAARRAEVQLERGPCEHAANARRSTVRSASRAGSPSPRGVEVAPGSRVFQTRMQPSGVTRSLSAPSEMTNALSGSAGSTAIGGRGELAGVSRDAAARDRGSQAARVDRARAGARDLETTSQDGVVWSYGRAFDPHGSFEARGWLPGWTQVDRRACRPVTRARG